MAPCETPANFAIVAIVIGLVGPPVSLAARFTPGIPLDPKDSPSEGWFIVHRREGFTRNPQAKSLVSREKYGGWKGLGTLFLNFGLWFGQEIAQHERQHGDAHGDVANGLGDVYGLFIGNIGQSYDVQRSTDLIAWPLFKSVLPSPDGTIPLLDPAPPTDKAFYRIEETP